MGVGNFYYYLRVVVGNPHSVNPRVGPLNASDNLVAYTHTHPNSNSFSGNTPGANSGDIPFANKTQVPIYVNGPNLQVQKYDPANGQTTTVGNPIAPSILSKVDKQNLARQYYAVWYSSSHFVNGQCVLGFKCGSMPWPTP